MNVSNLPGRDKKKADSPSQQKYSGKAKYRSNLAQYSLNLYVIYPEGYFF